MDWTTAMERMGEQSVDVVDATRAALTITIPYPSYIPRARGIHAVGKFGALLKAKCNKTELQNVIDAAGLVGVSKSEFIRWCANHCAIAILSEALRGQDQVQHDTEPEHERDD